MRAPPANSPPLQLLLALALIGCPADGDDTTNATATAASSEATATTSASASASASAGTTATTAALTETAGSTGVDTRGSTDGTVTDGTTTSASTATTSDGTTTDGVTDGTTSDATTDGTTDGTTSDTTGDATTGGTTTDGTTDGTTTDGTTTGDTTTGGGDLEPFFPPCDQIAIAAPITLDDLQQATSWRTPAGLAWDGQDLVVVRDDRNEQINKCETVFERRSAAGELVAPAVRSPSKGNCAMNGALGYNKASDVFLFTHQVTGLRVGLVGLDAGGAILWEKSEWDVCNSLTTTIDVAPRGDGFMVMGEQYSCDFNGPRHTSAAYYTKDGVREYLLQTAKATGSCGDAACDLPACDRLLTLRFGLENGESGTYAQAGDLALGTLDAKKTKLNGSAYGGWDASGAVWNGDDWLTLRIEDTGPSHKGHIRRWDEALGWTTSDVTFGSGETPTEIELLWTGSDYLAFYAEWPDNNMGLPDDWYDLDIWYLLIAADGTIKQSKIFERSQGYGGYAPQLAMIAGKIALSWVRVAKVGNANNYSRHLSFIECTK